jgi:hypothetical protein
MTLPWKRLPRPTYPLDPIDDWRSVSLEEPASAVAQKPRKHVA